MSSAILYLAIVAIWAGVLIPRWLRRDSSASNRAGDHVTDTTVQPETAPEEKDSPVPSRRDEGKEPAEAPRARPMARSARPETPKGRPVAPEGRPVAQKDRPVAPEGRPGAPEGRPAARAGQARTEVRPAEARREAARDLERKRMLTARRRLLLMLLALTSASAALAITEMAAWWVVLPPSVMLLGYLSLLKEAAKADAEQREMARAQAARAAAARTAAAAKKPAPKAAPPAPAPHAEVIEISATRIGVPEEFFDQYADAKLRAVGDLCPFRLSSRPARASAFAPSGPAGRGTRCWGGR